MTTRTRRSIVRIACLAALASVAACNPTWTKDGKANDSSMPLPPGASTPQQAGVANGASPAPAAKP